MLGAGEEEGECHAGRIYEEQVVSCAESRCDAGDWVVDVLCGVGGCGVCKSQGYGDLLKILRNSKKKDRN